MTDEIDRAIRDAARLRKQRGNPQFRSENANPGGWNKGMEMTFKCPICGAEGRGNLPSHLPECEG